ncbi:MAG: dihydrolipoyl dehydrogenase [Planctomycetes bacterium]|nr:dihydrolipoyl dehydrogenase [Planctomycetota bacterium]
MTEQVFDLIVLGGGNAITVGIRAAKEGKSVAIIEKDRLGGTCPNRGCIPSKLLIGFADVAAGIRGAKRFHIDASIEGVDRDAIFRETKAATFDVTDGKIAANLPEGVTLVRGHGRFVAPRTLEVKGQRLRAATVIVATGTRPDVPDRQDLAGLPIWTSDDVFELEQVPESIAIVGGGYIACELAHVFASLGVRTIQIVRSERLLRQEDDEIAAVFDEGYTQHVDVRKSCQIDSVRHGQDGFSIGLVGNGKSHQIEVEALLFATGRNPNCDDIGLDAAGIARDDRGFIRVDDHLRTNADGVFALGDVKGGYQFTHAAAWEATYLGNCLFDRHEAPLDYGPMPHAVFSYPEIAGVGQTERELKASGTPYVATSLPYTSAAKGRAVKEQHGRCKFLLAPSGEILGCHIVGHEASVLLHEVIPVMKWKNHISSLTGIIHIHPSLSEVVRNCARKAEASLTA